MSDAIVKVVVETEKGKISHICTNFQYSRTRILDQDTIDTYYAKEFLDQFSDTLLDEAKRRLVDIVVQSEKEEDLKALDRIITDHLPGTRLRELIVYCRTHPEITIYHTIYQLRESPW